MRVVTAARKSVRNARIALAGLVHTIACRVGVTQDRGAILLLGRAHQDATAYAMPHAWFWRSPRITVQRCCRASIQRTRISTAVSSIRGPSLPRNSALAAHGIPDSTIQFADGIVLVHDFLRARIPPGTAW